MHTYRVRDSFGNTPSPLIEFINVDEDKIVTDLKKILKSLGYRLKSKSDLWMNKEVIYTFRSSKGAVEFSTSFWGTFFITNNDEPRLINEIANQLNKSLIFKDISNEDA